MCANKRRLDELGKLVGRTPMAEILLSVDGQERKVYAKLEYYNLTGSIKDRVAVHCLRRAMENGELKPGDAIVETTSGNTGISFCAVGGFLGHPTIIFMPDWMSEERRAIISSFGAKLCLVSREEGGFVGAIQLAKEFAKANHAYLPDQFSNRYNTEAHYKNTAPEIASQMDQLGTRPHGFVAGVGTGGTIMGVGRYLKTLYPGFKVFPMEPASSPVLKTGYKTGKHRIAGISDEFIPDIMELDKCDDIIDVDDGDAIIMAQRLARELGLGVGISSGANLIAAIKAGDIVGQGSNLVTVFSDDNKKYLTTDYAKEEPTKDGYLSNKIKLLDVRITV